MSCIAYNVCAERDGYPADAEHVYLSNGASGGVNTLLHVICSKPETGILVPIPQYPLYTATLSVLNARCVPYYLDESHAWGTDMGEIKSALKKARSEGTDVKAIVVINPGNPTGASLSEESIKSVLELAQEEKLVVMADEVYQTNVFEGKFISFKKGLRDLQKAEPGKYDNLELASLHSISKGMVGECGHRGGYFELIGFDEKVAAEVYKFISIQLCPPVIGQCMVEMMVNPPQEGDPSYELYKQEYDSIFKGLLERAQALYKAFKEMEGVECQSPAVSIPNPRPQTPLSPVPSYIARILKSIPISGLNVPLPHNPPTKARNRGRGKGRPQARRVLLLPNAGRDRGLRGCWIGLWSEGGDAAFPHDVFGAGHGVGGEDYEVP